MNRWNGPAHKGAMRELREARKKNPTPTSKQLTETFTAPVEDTQQAAPKVRQKHLWSSSELNWAVVCSVCGGYYSTAINKTYCDEKVLANRRQIDEQDPKVTP
jgi:hypothetical protein